MDSFNFRIQMNTLHWLKMTLLRKLTHRMLAFCLRVKSIHVTTSEQGQKLFRTDSAAHGLCTAVKFVHFP